LKMSSACGFLATRHRTAWTRWYGLQRNLCYAAAGQYNKGRSPLACGIGQG